MGYKKVVDEMSGSGFAASAGDADGASGAGEFEEKSGVHFDGDVLTASGLEKRVIPRNGGISDDEIGVLEQLLRMVSEGVGDGEVFELLERRLELVGGFLVGDGDLGSDLGEDFGAANSPTLESETHDDNLLATISLRKTLERGHI